MGHGKDITGRIIPEAEQLFFYLLHYNPSQIRACLFPPKTYSALSEASFIPIVMPLESTNIWVEHLHECR